MKMLDKNAVLFRRALTEAMEIKLSKIEKENENVELPPYSTRHKRRMNRLFRDYVVGSFVPFPEEDILDDSCSLIKYDYLPSRDKKQ